MPDDIELRRTLSEPAARQLANATKTRAQMLAITPRWLISFLPWVPVEAGIYRLNKVKERDGLGEVECSPSWERDTDLPETFVDYDQTPREYFLNAVTTVLDVQTRVSDLYNSFACSSKRSRSAKRPSSFITRITVLSAMPRLR